MIYLIKVVIFPVHQRINVHNEAHNTGDLSSTAISVGKLEDPKNPVVDDQTIPLWGFPARHGGLPKLASWFL